MILPVTHAEIVMGKIYGLMLLGLVQIGFFLAAGKYLFHLNLGANLPGVIVTLILFAWVAGSLGVLVGSVIAAPDRVNGICVLAGLLFAADVGHEQLGGGVFWGRAACVRRRARCKPAVRSSRNFRSAPQPRRRPG